MKAQNRKVFSLSEEEILSIERLNYIFQSYSAFISILAREYSNSPSESLSEMIDEYRQLCQKSWIELSVRQNALFKALFETVPQNMEFNFDFNRMEVTCSW